MNNPELVFYAGSSLLEGPCWDPIYQTISCVSIEQCQWYIINEANASIVSYSSNGPIGCAVKKDTNLYWSAEKSGVYETNILTGDRKLLIQPETDSFMRFNDGKLDPVGRFIFGSMGFDREMPGGGKVYSYDGSICKVIIENVTISNGIAFSEDGTIMYYIDTPSKEVKKYSYDIYTGSATYIGSVIKFDSLGLPDGMCMDLDGMLWIAEWNGGKVCKWNPNTGDKLQEICLPCKNVTSCCLGGKDLNYLFVTTARNDSEFEPFAGGLFKVKIR